MIQLLNSKSQIDVLCNLGVQSYLKICKSLILEKNQIVQMARQSIGLVTQKRKRPKQDKAGNRIG